MTNTTLAAISEVLAIGMAMAILLVLFRVQAHSLRELCARPSALRLLVITNLVAFAAFVAAVVTHFVPFLVVGAVVTGVFDYVPRPLLLLSGGRDPICAVARALPDILGLLDPSLVTASRLASGIDERRRLEQFRTDGTTAVLDALDVWIEHLQDPESTPQATEIERQRLRSTLVDFNSSHSA